MSLSNSEKIAKIAANITEKKAAEIAAKEAVKADYKDKKDKMSDSERIDFLFAYLGISDESEESTS